MKVLDPLVEPSNEPSELQPAPSLTRHSARELALQVLFQWDFHGTTDGWLDEFWAQQRSLKPVRVFANQLVVGVQAQQEEIDQLIEQVAENWSLDRMAIVDRNILRQTIYELIWIPDIPAKVSVDEALQLAKSFADDEAKRFVNGILDKILRHDPRLEEKRTHIR
ncbi:MAG: transcription antitermination factor NusB [Nitrospirae bacterium]|nr:transcription antitermination factor NusB [Nitrospirota bacterium]MDA1304505.1 transcription antitermination factor NusB [Nitrospirota bacterium]